jgi:hypothetical protein
MTIDPATTRIQAIERLRTLPEVFSLRDLELLMDINRKTAHQLCWRWKKAKFVQGLGPRSGVYYNIFKDPMGPNRRRGEALQKLLGHSPIVVGATALHLAGWTTQRPNRVELCVPRTRDWRVFPKIHGVLLVSRPRHWFNRIAPYIREGVDGLRALAPEAALIDAMQHGGRGEVWKPSPDDLDVPNEDDEAQRIMETAKALRMDFHEAYDLITDLNLKLDVVGVGGLSR